MACFKLTPLPGMTCRTFAPHIAADNPESATKYLKSSSEISPATRVSRMGVKHENYCGLHEFP